MTALRRRFVLVAAAVLAVTLLVPAGAASAGARTQAAGCPPVVAFDPADFQRTPGEDASTRIDNRFLPMVPGTRWVYEGRTAGGVHRVVTTVTDLTKEVAGVRTRVLLDVDIEDGQVIESELAFFAQDTEDRVWSLGEYPEEFEEGVFVGAPSTWITGLQGAQAGVHMRASPQAPGFRNVQYLQGRAPAIDFLDCAEVVDIGGTARVPAGTFDQVLTTHERSPLESATAIQTKEHAPNVGIVRIGFINDPEGEVLRLTRFGPLSADVRERANAQACRLDAHGRATSALYRSTSPVLGC